MDIIKSFGQSYLSPVTQIVEIDPEGILCASGDEPSDLNMNPEQGNL